MINNISIGYSWNLNYHATMRKEGLLYPDITPPCMPKGSFPFPPPGPTFVFNEIFMQFMEFQSRFRYKVFQVELILSHKTFYRKKFISTR